MRGQWLTRSSVLVVSGSVRRGARMELAMLDCIGPEQCGEEAGKSRGAPRRPTMSERTLCNGLDEINSKVPTLRVIWAGPAPCGTRRHIGVLGDPAAICSAHRASIGRRVQVARGTFFQNVSHATP